MNAVQVMDDLARGVITFDEVKAKFEQATFTTRQPTQGDWGDVWSRADNLPEGDDIPEALETASYARTITPQQKEQLYEIYERKLGVTLT